MLLKALSCFCPSLKKNISEKKQKEILNQREYKKTRKKILARSKEIEEAIKNDARRLL
jgi:hypothetical protein